MRKTPTKIVIVVNLVKLCKKRKTELMYVLMVNYEARSDNAERIIGSLRGQSGQKA